MHDDLMDACWDLTLEPTIDPDRPPLCLLCVLQVLDWIENHGEAFLSKHTGVGKSLHRARALQKRHEDFEEVAQVRQPSPRIQWC